MTTATDPGDVITAAQMYAELRQVHDEVKGIRSDLKTLKDHGNQLDDHETRLRALEQKVWRAAGAATVIGAGIAVVVQFLAR